MDRDHVQWVVPEGQLPQSSGPTEPVTLLQSNAFESREALRLLNLRSVEQAWGSESESSGVSSRVVALGDRQ